MGNTSTALGIFRHVSPARWAGLAWYFFGRAVCRGTGLRLFQERILRFKPFSVVAGVEGLSGLVFLHEILVRGIYDFPELESDPGVKVVFDVGANCGFFTLTQAARHPGWRFFCFEPQPATVEHLKKNIAVNRLDSRAQAIHAAGGRASGECSLEVSATSSMGIVSSSTARVLESPSLVTVPMLSLDDFARRENVWPDLLKIDVEGFEVEVLDGAVECLKRARHVLLEFHSEELRRRCAERLAAAGFQTKVKGPLMVARR